MSRKLIFAEKGYLKNLRVVEDILDKGEQSGGWISVRPVCILDIVMGLIILRHYPSLIEAELAKGLLEQSGIRSILQKDPLPGAGSFLQGAEILVQSEDEEQARSLVL